MLRLLSHDSHAWEEKGHTAGVPTAAGTPPFTATNLKRLSGISWEDQLDRWLHVIIVGWRHSLCSGQRGTGTHFELLLRGDAALLWKIAHACKGTNINLQTKFKCLCDSRWRLKIASASGSAGTLVFMILLLFRNSKLDQWETLLSWPVVQFAARKYRYWNLTNTSTNLLHSPVGRVKIAGWWCSLAWVVLLQVAPQDWNHLDSC